MQGWPLPPPWSVMQITLSKRLGSPSRQKQQEAQKLLWEMYRHFDACQDKYSS